MSETNNTTVENTEGKNKVLNMLIPGVIGFIVGLVACYAIVTATVVDTAEKAQASIEQSIDK